MDPIPANLASSVSPAGASLHLVELRAIDKYYGGVQVLKQARLSVPAGEVHGLVGENGAGKSTLVKILAGEVLAEGGEIHWEGRPVRVNSRLDAARLGISMIHQELSLAPHLSVSANIFLGQERTRYGLIDSSAERDATRLLLERLEFELHPATPVRRLGPAQRQLVEIARAVVGANRLVIMDEPTSSLSAKEVQELFRVVRKLKEQGTAVIFVTHRLEELAEIADRVTVLRDGETVYEGVMPRQDFRALIQAMVGRELKDFFPRRAARLGPVALEARGLSRGGVFEDASFTVREGEIVGLAGVVGAGRTELAETLFGAMRAERGQVFIGGQAVEIRAPQDAIRLGVALLTEDRKRTGLALGLNVTHNITLANLRALTSRGILRLKQEEQVAQGFLERLRIRAPSVRLKTGRLSGGNQQKVVLGKWLFREAKIFLFDEPTRGVDVGAKTEIYRLMNQLAEAGGAILMISSELPEILGMTDRVLVMRNGRLVRELITAQTTQEEIIRYATLGEA